MDIKETKKYIKVMQAYVDGEVIEHSEPGSMWRSINNPSWWWDRIKYRIKPKPMEVYINCHDGKPSSNNYRFPSDCVNNSNSGAIIKFREVLDD